MKFLRNNKAASGTEYGLLAGLIGAVAVTSVYVLGGDLGNTFSTADSSLQAGFEGSDLASLQDEGTTGEEGVPEEPGVNPLAMTLVVNTNNATGTQVQLPLSVGGGLVNVDVDWGDGTVETITTSGFALHTYASDGTYTISISGTLSKFGGSGDEEFCENLTYDSRQLMVESVTNFGDLGLTSLECAFGGMDNLTISAALPNTVTDLSRTFLDNQQVTLGVASWDVSNVTTMVETFHSADFFNENLSSWNTSSVTDMAQIFREAGDFNQPLNSWNVSNVVNFNYAFVNAHSFNQPLDQWNVSSATDFGSMFMNAWAFNQDMGNWVFASGASINSMFNGANSFNGDISGWNTCGVTNFGYFMANASVFNQDLSGWCTTGVSGTPAGYDLNATAWQSVNKPAWPPSAL